MTATTPSAEYSQQRRADGAACVAAALDYLRRGWSVLALCPPDHVGVGKGHGKSCTSPGKVPWGPWAEFQERLPTEDELRRKWADNPTLNVGAACGPASGWIRCDVEGIHGEARLLELCGGKLPNTLEFKSGRKDDTGRGLLFAIPDGVILKTTVEAFCLHDELRFQAKSAQTVLPPSRHKDGGLYQWVPGHSPDDLPMAPMPDWLVKLMCVEPVASGGAGTKTADVDLRQVLSALDGFPNSDLHYDTWLAIGMILKSVDSSDAMRDVWVKWSKQSNKKHQDGVCEIKWASFGKRERGINPDTGRPNLLGVGTLFMWATEATGWHYGPRIIFGTEESANGGGKGGDNSHSNGRPSGPPCGWQIIRDYFQRRYGNGYRIGDAIYCNAERREVKRQEACSALPPDLIGPLGEAENAPRFTGENGGRGPVKIEALPGFFRKWAGTAWAALLQILPDEDAAEPGAVEVAREEFCRLVRQALLSEFTLARKVRDERGGIETRIELRSAIGWCETFAKVGPWKTVRSKKLWCRQVELDGGEIRLQVAIRHEFFSQIKADRRLIDMGSNTFTRRGQRYKVGKPGGQANRPGGQWAFILADDFVNDLTATIPDESCTPPESTNPSD